MSFKEKWLLILLFFLALGLRSYRLSEVPPGLNRDEAAIGYTAYSLLENGTDEYGLKWPLSFKSFGDWKVPVYFYLAMPSVFLLGLTEFSTRLPSALGGSLTVALTYILVKKLLGYDKAHKDRRGVEEKGNFVKVASFLSALSLAISPWHLFMSRNASESNIAVLFVVSGLVLFFHGFQRPRVLPLSAIFLALSMFTYHGNHIFTPLLFGGLTFFYWKEVYKIRWFWVGVSIFAALTILILSQTLFEADRTKISGLFPLGDEAKIYEKIDLRRLEYQSQSPLVRLLHNKPLYLIKTIMTNYVKGLSPEFLFISGGTNFQHNIPEFGNLYFWEAFIWPIALFGLLVRKGKVGKFLLFWLLISPVAASITKDAPHTNRMMGILPLPGILSGFGLTYIFWWASRKKYLLAIVVLLSLGIAANFIVYLDQYYAHFPYVSEKHWGKPYKELVAKVNGLESSFEEVVISQPDFSPYIYFLFHNRVKPEIYQANVVRYPETSEGFQHVQKFGKLKFENIDWTDELLLPDLLYVDWVDHVPSGATNSAIFITEDELLRLAKKEQSIHKVKKGDWVTSRVIDKVELSNGTPYLYLIATQIGTPSGTIYSPPQK